MISSVKDGIVDLLFKTKVSVPKEVVGVFEQSPKSFVHNDYSPLQKEKEKEESKVIPQHTGKKVGRNEPCPCGSGKKYKKCCGK
jgi:uncharacterized protein YecA (UPF0149 family)